MKERKALDTEHRKVERTLAKEGKRPFFIGSCKGCAVILCLF